MKNIFSAFGASPKGFESFSDRLNSRTTVVVLLAFASIIAIQVLVRTPIVCFSPAQFTEKHTEYADKICWSAKYYYIPTLMPEEKSKIKSTYHQWIPFILAFQAFLFYLPKLLRNLGYSYSGTISTRHIESAALQSSFAGENSAQTVLYMVRCLGQRLVDLESSWKIASVTQRCLILLTCNVSSMFHLAAKLLYVTNVIGQLCLLNAFLGDSDGEYDSWALGRLLRIWQGKPWETSSALPQVFLCEFEMRHQSRVHNYAVQCHLWLNLWYEFMFLFIWTWFVFVAMVTLGSLVVFVLTQVNIYYQERYCRIRLLAMGKANNAQFRQISRFVSDFMTRDVWYFVQQVSRVSGDPTATELVGGLWDCYLAHTENYKPTESATTFYEPNK